MILEHQTVNAAEVQAHKVQVKQSLRHSAKARNNGANEQQNEAHCFITKNHYGTEHFIHHLRLCGKHWTNTWLPATSHHHHTYRQHRRHLHAGIPDDGSRRLCLYAAGATPPPQYHLVNANHQCCHLHMQLHNLCNKDIQQVFT